MEALGFGLIVTLIGMAVTFIGLTVLILLINGLVRVTTRNKKTEVKSLRAEATKETATFDKSPEAMSVSSSDEEEIRGRHDSSMVAAITAALTIVMHSDSKFIVRRIKRIG